MPVLVAPDFRVPHPSSASFEHSLHSFCLPHIYPAQSSPSNSVCLWLAPFCVPQHHIWLPKVILTFFFFFQLDVPPSWSKPAELCSSRDVFARTEYSSRSF